MGTNRQGFQVDHRSDDHAALHPLGGDLLLPVVPFLQLLHLRAGQALLSRPVELAGVFKVRFFLLSFVPCILLHLLV
jgi:hypothetical protein